MSLNANTHAFEDCDVWCGNRPEEPGETGHQWFQNYLSGGIQFFFNAGHTQHFNTASCVGIFSVGWRYQRFGEGPEYEWRITPYHGQWDLGVFYPDEYDWLNIGPYVGVGTIEDLIVREDEEGSLTGGIWLDNEKAGESCAHHVPDRLMIIDNASAGDYLEVSGLGPYLP